jgi:hypothetical protein
VILLDLAKQCVQLGVAPLQVTCGAVYCGQAVLFVNDTAGGAGAGAGAAAFPAYFAERPVYEAAKKKGYLQVMLVRLLDWQTQPVHQSVLGHTAAAEQPDISKRACKRFCWHTD